MMNRRLFWGSFVVSISSFFAAPFRAIAGDPPSKGFKVASGKDRFNRETVYGAQNPQKCKVSGKDTNGELFILEQKDIKGFGPPLHVHPNQDEWLFVLEGQYQVKIGEELFILRKGDSAFGPRGVPHTFLPVAEGENRLLITYQPAGKMEEFYQAMQNPQYRDRKDMKTRFLEHEIEIVGPMLEARN